MRTSVLGTAVGLVLGFLLLTSVAQVHAQAQEVTRLVDEGLKLRTEGRDAEALERFEAAYRLEQQPRVLTQIALAEQALGRWLSAHTHLSEALVHRDDPWITQWQAELESTLRRIESELGSLEVVSNISGATVIVDGRKPVIVQLGQPMRTLPGTYSVRVELTGYQTFLQTVEVQKGTASRVEATLVRAEQPAAAAPAQPATAPIVGTQVASATAVSTKPAPESTPAGSKPFFRRKQVLITAGVIAATSFAIAATTYAVAGSKARSLQTDCYENWCDADERGPRRDAIKRLDNVSRVFLGLGLATVVATGIAYAVAGHSDAEPSPKKVSIDAAVGPSHAVLQSTMRF